MISIEYEGWIPDIDPHLDCVTETRRGIDLIKRHLNSPTSHDLQAAMSG